MPAIRRGGLLRRPAARPDRIDTRTDGVLQTGSCVDPTPAVRTANAVPAESISETARQAS